MKLKLDLHEIFNHGRDIDRALRDIMDEAVTKKATLVEIIPGKGSGQLKKRVLRFLDQKVSPGSDRTSIAAGTKIGYLPTAA